MMKKMLFLAVLLLAGMLTISAQTEGEDPDAKYATDLLRPGTTAPDFVIAATDSGHSTRLSSFRGRYVVLDFWASWCPDCRRDIARMKALHEEYSPRGVQIIGVSFDTDLEAWNECIQKYKMTWMHYSELRKWKKESKIDQDYHVNWIPTYYIIDPEGKVVLGTVVADKVEQTLRRLCGDKPAVSAPAGSGKTVSTISIPRFPGGETARQTFMSTNLEYPALAMKYRVEAKVEMEFDVEENGQLANIAAGECSITSYNKTLFDKLTPAKQEELKKTLNLEFTKSAYNVMEKMPAWTPGMRNETPVKMKMRQMITYYLR